MTQFVEQRAPEAINLAQCFGTDLRELMADPNKETHELGSPLRIVRRDTYTTLLKNKFPINEWDLVQSEHYEEGEVHRRAGTMSIIADVPELGSSSGDRILMLGEITLDQIEVWQGEQPRRSIRTTNIYRIGGSSLTGTNDTPVEATTILRTEKRVYPRTPSVPTRKDTAEFQRETNPYVRTIEELAELYDQLRSAVAFGLDLETGKSNLNDFKDIQ